MNCFHSFIDYVCFFSEIPVSMFCPLFIVSLMDLKVIFINSEYFLLFYFL